eukprot:Blabericola_migrator_1__6322@NODE_3190_length_1958_cov_57_699101_g1974_i1_p1_GENE_NODE_3190_length_1958_cov_57_699101_g1974_i1NODE_3190_length_1958_cov_57_699101_g1974_i1_p1_ORF_typecomplete_len229_score28_20NT5C/PF06941_12/2_7e28HAD/PF12710_7/0_0037Put_Phosphatase/PF06888_12/0_0069HAD_2/PF13419_6/0_021_NODE_3190_length_1958_cov_57_699101_g1974_i189775
MLSGREVVPLHLPAIPTRNCVCQEAHHEPGAGEGRSMKGTILVDMDNTLNDWDSQFTRLMKYLEPNFPFVEPEQRREYSIENNYPESLRAQILSLTSLRGFWSTMPVAPGAKQALSEMADSGLDVWIVSAPDPDLTGRCAMEKYEWLELNFGPRWKNRLILTQDKTLVHGNLLIDDKPTADVGVRSKEKSWQHVVYCHPYNEAHRCAAQWRLHSWSDWRKVILPALSG